MRSILLGVLVAVIATPAAAQSIRVGQTINGELTTSDLRLDDGSYVDCYDLQTRTGQRLQIDQTAALFDSYLSVMTGGCQNPTGLLARDDDSGGGLNSRLVLDGDGALWGLAVNSIESAVTGGYQLSVAAVAQGTTAAPASPSRPSLPRVESTWETDALTCAGAYSAMVSLQDQGVAPTDYGNVAQIDYSARAERLRGRLQGTDLSDVEDYAGNFEMMALFGMQGMAPNGSSNGHRPLAEYLTVLANCDRAFNLTPVTAY